MGMGSFCCTEEDKEQERDFGTANVEPVRQKDESIPETRKFQDAENKQIVKLQALFRGQVARQVVKE